ncbi:MAG: hypothetical protein MHPSP_001904, partial [Paramarteilia canceri]
MAWQDYGRGELATQIKLTGPLKKWTNHFAKWQVRHFVLDGELSRLSYYMSDPIN